MAASVFPRSRHFASRMGRLSRANSPISTISIASSSDEDEADSKDFQAKKSFIVGRKVSQTAEKTLDSTVRRHKPRTPNIGEISKVLSADSKGDLATGDVSDSADTRGAPKRPAECRPFSPPKRRIIDDECGLEKTDRSCGDPSRPAMLCSLAQVASALLKNDDSIFSPEMLPKLPKLDFRRQGVDDLLPKPTENAQEPTERAQGLLRSNPVTDVESIRRIGLKVERHSHRLTRFRNSFAVTAAIAKDLEITMILLEAFSSMPIARNPTTADVRL